MMTESRLDYIALLQQQVSKNTTKLLDVCTEEDHEESAQSSRLTLPTLCSVPRNLTISPGLGGAALTPQLTEGVRRILFGGTFHVFNYEWKKSVFRFRETHTEFSYALHTDRCGARAVQMAVQARIIKHLLFGSDGRTLHSLTQVGQRDQEKALAAALADSLWLAGDDVSATVTLVTEDYCITPHLDYKLDHVTERLQLFTFTQKEDVTRFILEHIQCFTEEGSHGVILFIYSLVCSRSVLRLREDLDCPTSHLLYRSLGNFVCRQALVNLLLTGRASPHVFNGTVCCGDDGRALERPLQGVMTRCDVGYLHWSREEMDARRLPQVGSMLKTPLFPVWLCCINRSFSVAFSPTRSLLSDWKVEHLFTLLYYGGQHAQSSSARITVDTHSHHWEAPVRQTDGDPEKHFPSLDMTIRTKWAGAAISWNGTVPFY